MIELNNKHIYNQKGFTLIEVLISITILSFIMLGVISFTESSQSVSQRVISEDKEMLQLETAMSRLEWDFSQVYSPLYFSQTMDPTNMSNEQGELYNQLIASYERNARFSSISYEGLPIPLFQKPEKSTIILFTSSNRRKLKNTKQSYYGWVKYSLINADDAPNGSDEYQDGNESRFVLVRHFASSDIYNSEPIDWDELKTQVLFRKVIKMNFELWNESTQKWTENIDIIKDGKNLIRGLKLTLTFLDPSNIEKTTIRIFRPLFPKYKPEDMYKFTSPQTSAKESGGSIE